MVVQRSAGRRRTPPEGERGMLAAALAVMALVLFGALTIVAGSLNFQTSSSRGGDAEQVVDAAEWGLNTLLEQLNEPAYQHLLVTPLANWETSGNDRTACGINAAAAPGDPGDITSATRTVGNLEVQYELVDFVPPLLPSNAVNPCGASNPFGNLNGGTARLTVEGRVLRNGVVIGRHTVVRDVTVVAETTCTGADGPCSQPLAFLGTGNPLDLFSGNSRIVRDNGTTRWQWDAGDTPLALHCFEPSLASCQSDNPGLSVEPLAESSFQALYGASPPVPADLDSITTPISITNTNFTPSELNFFPYSTPSPTATTSPRSGCIKTLLPKPNGSQEEVVACRVLEIDLSNATLTVNTGLRPVVLYISPGETVSLSSTSAIVNSQFSSSPTSTTRSLNSTRWNRLRIYGDSTDSACPPDPTWTISGRSRIEGAAIWAPRDQIRFDISPAPSSEPRYAVYGTIWACGIDYAPDHVHHLVNPEENDLTRGIDEMFGLQIRRYRTRGVERSAPSS
jgi:hypothetical protein